MTTVGGEPVCEGGHGCRTVAHLSTLHQSTCYALVPMPIWVNEDGMPAETRLCPRPGCGREHAILRYRYETLGQIGWPLFRVARYVEWRDMGKS